MPEPRMVSLSPLGTSPEEIAGRTFATVRRGYEPDAVRRFLDEIAGQVRQARAREAELQALLADAEKRASSPVLDEAVLTAAVGNETARVLQVAHEAAQEVVAKAEARAALLVEDASTVHATRAAAAEAEAALVVEEGQRVADELVERTKQECRSMLDEAREARRRILDDLAARRRELHGQIGQLRAAKDALADIVAAAATAVTEIQSRLAGSEDEAREAAEEVVHQMIAVGELDEVLDHGALMGETPLGETPLGETIGGELPAVPSVLPATVPPAVYDEALEDLVASLAAETLPEEQLPGDAYARDALPEEQLPGDAYARDALPEELAAEELAAEEPAAEELAAEEPAAEELAVAEAISPDEPQVEVSAVVVAELDGVGGPVTAEESTRPEPEPGGEALAPEADATSAVDALFARIRASRAEEVARARAVLGEVTGAAAGEPEASAGAGDKAAAGEAPEVEPPEVEAPEIEAPEVEERVEAALPEGSALAARRDELLDPVRIEVSRALKRVLRSQQNELLDAARSLKPADAEELLAGDETALRIAEAVEPGVVAAWRAGWELAGATGGTEEVGHAADVIARALADEVVEAIDGRLRDGIAALDMSGPAGPGGDEGLGELVGLAYRDWKGARVDAVAADFALRAFAAGSLAGAAEQGMRVRWLLESDQPCADCDDNALSEPLAPGETFPTGQVQPPLHPGCRCVLVAVTS